MSNFGECVYRHYVAVSDCIENAESAIIGSLRSVHKP